MTSVNVFSKKIQNYINFIIDIINFIVYNLTIIYIIWGHGMNLSDKIKILCIRSNISVSKLARLTGNTPQNFHGKMKRESFTQKEFLY